MRFYAGLVRFIVCFALVTCASAVFAQHHHRDREWQAVLNNTGRRTHTFQLIDNRDSDNRVYTVGPGQQHATRRAWHADTSLFIDGRFVGKLRDLASLQTGTNGRVWVVELHREHRRR